MYSVNEINKSFGDKKILDGIDLDFSIGKTTAIMGPSGCGKTTFLKILSSIIEADSGEIIGFKDKVISFVFQEARLIPWLNIEENLSFILSSKYSHKKIKRIIDEHLEIVDMLEYKKEYPAHLSEGMRQRISILRAFIYPSELMLLDEPFKSLDLYNKNIVMDYFKKLMKHGDKTAIFVTHDLDEAIVLADEIVIFSDKPTKVKQKYILDENLAELKDIITSCIKAI